MIEDILERIIKHGGLMPMDILEEFIIKLYNKSSLKHKTLIYNCYPGNEYRIRDHITRIIIDISNNNKDLQELFSEKHNNSRVICMSLGVIHVTTYKSAEYYTIIENIETIISNKLYELFENFKGVEK